MENCPNADLEACFYDGEWTGCVCGPAAKSSTVKARCLSTRRSEDAQDIRAGARGGEERQVVHGEGRGGTDRPEPREQAVCGAVWWGPQHVSGSRGRHHSRGAAQHQERPFLPHHHRQVGKCCYWRSLSPFALFDECFPYLFRRPANPSSPSPPSHSLPPETAPPPQVPQITPSVSLIYAPSVGYRNSRIVV